VKCHFQCSKSYAFCTDIDAIKHDVGSSKFQVINKSLSKGRTEKTTVQIFNVILHRVVLDRVGAFMELLSH
jgi:hypothetical protein